ncbi:MAG: alkaline phosphatase family protein [Planctomycetaceae bacterium]|nr:alkaline phosphatase family protein [Planctomycetaceae bacterium]
MIRAVDALPLVFAGPILRRTTPTRVVFWLAVREPVRIRLVFDTGESTTRDFLLTPGQTSGCRLLTAGTHLHYLLIDLPFAEPLPLDRWIKYHIALQPLRTASAEWLECSDDLQALCYEGQDSLGFMLPSRVGSLLHGSCRKPHHPGGDGLVEADRLLARCLLANPTADGVVANVETESDPRCVWPSALVLSGDQIYADEVAGPTLHAIHQLISLLGIPNEPLAGGEWIKVDSAQSLYRHPAGFYRRETLLPRHKRNYALIELLFGGVEKPVFTTASAHNHLITLGEVLGMYLLVWSPSLWSCVDLEPPATLQAKERSLYAKERAALESFIATLPAVRRLFAHLPVAMIFDDHDITDDWNLSREWEEVAYGNPFSKRVIGNALVGYLVHQAWGNDPDAFSGELMDTVRESLESPGGAAHDQCIDQLLRFDHWHYHWPTSPPLVVLDSRTHRWRSEIAAREPSGLMDWESLTDLQQTLRGLPAVLLVSPTPIFGVKLIESVQRVFTWFGYQLMVDAENWMAHPGSAQAMLNIFRHPKTPQNFVVLSGDVHYSFVYDVELRGKDRGPDIWQICSSALRNEFPPRLLNLLDRANRWLYAPRSPLNWFTRRRSMRVIPRKPEGTPHGRRLLNGSGIGLVEIDEHGVPWRIRKLLAEGRAVVFSRREAESRWD